MTAKTIVSETTYLVGSGKGGVGKSTVTVNLAISMAQLGFKVGILDADIYGPSIPCMMGLRRLRPQEAAEGKLRPFEKFGVKVMSVGFLVEEARSLVWRGPMLHSVLEQMVKGVEWGELDVMLVDLPPGTGDVPITLSKLFKVDGCIVVTTPQEVAILDAIKAINSYHQLKLPLIGIIENMAGYSVPGLEETHFIFGQGKGAELAERMQSELLGSIPFLPAIGANADVGVPVAVNQGDDNAGGAFHGLARCIVSKHYVEQ
jgi:ATP-binding protein involved in chromosome partitioning